MRPVQFFWMVLVALPRAIFRRLQSAKPFPAASSGLRNSQRHGVASGTGKVDPVPTSVNFATIVFGYTTATAVAR